MKGLFGTCAKTEVDGVDLVMQVIQLDGCGVAMWMCLKTSAAHQL